MFKFLIKHHALKTYRGVKVTDQVHASPALLPRKNPLLLHRRLGECDRQSECYGEENNLLPHQESNPNSLVLQPVN
jgi:hypothetical protein